MTCGIVNAGLTTLLPFESGPCKACGRVADDLGLVVVFIGYCLSFFHHYQLASYDLDIMTDKVTINNIQNPIIA